MECNTVCQQLGRVISQRQLAHETYCLRIESAPIAQSIRPGQFFMIRTVGGTDPLLGRPFALYQVIPATSEPASPLDSNPGRATQFEFGYHVVGKMTSLMSQWSGGEPVELWGPLGNGFPLPNVPHLLCVGGGIGYTPFLAVAQQAAGVCAFGERGGIPQSACRRISFCYGVQTRSQRADLSDFHAIPGLEIHLATDDGSEGHHGYVTDLVQQILYASDPPQAVYCCGPEPMMHAVARLCEAAQVPCWLSLESPMACGFGACFSCVTPIRMDDGSWDYRRTCVEGPVFRADQLAF